MDIIKIKEKYINEFILGTLYSSKDCFEKISNEKYHHTTSYQNDSMICQNDILPLIELNKLEIRDDSFDLLEKINLFVMIGLILINCLLQVIYHFNKNNI